MQKYKSILIGKDSEEFIKKIELAISNMNNEKYLNLLEKKQRKMTGIIIQKSLELITKGRTMKDKFSKVKSLIRKYNLIIRQL